MLTLKYFKLERISLYYEVKTSEVKFIKTYLKKLFLLYNKGKSL